MCVRTVEINEEKTKVLKFMITDFRVRCIKPLVWNAGNRKPETVTRDIELLQDAIKHTVIEFAHENKVEFYSEDLAVTVEGSFKEV